MYYAKMLAAAVVALCLSGCYFLNGDNHVFQDRDTDYLKAKSIPPLKIPPGMSSDKIQSRYPISEREYPDSYKKPSLVPPGL